MMVITPAEREWEEDAETETLVPTLSGPSGGMTSGTSLIRSGYFFLSCSCSALLDPCSELSANLTDLSRVKVRSRGGLLT
jgi:hypothetical protein